MRPATSPTGGTRTAAARSQVTEWVSEWPSDGNLLEILAPEMKHALHSWPPDGNYSNDLAPF